MRSEDDVVNITRRMKLVGGKGTAEGTLHHFDVILLLGTKELCSRLRVECRTEKRRTF